MRLTMVAGALVLALGVSVPASIEAASREAGAQQSRSPGASAASRKPATNTRKPPNPEFERLWAATRGGRLYDHWAKELGIALPTETHPSYPDTGRLSGAVTWRCVTCHAWDYRGRDGRYRRGEFFTGVRGIRRAVGKRVSDLRRLLRDDRHRYTREMLPDEAADLLAQFVSRGQYDVALWIDPQTGRVKGEPVRGAPLYQNVCARCHGADGQTLNFGTAGEPSYLGSEARADPWKVMHKARFGEPGTGMLSYGEFFDRVANKVLVEPQDIADVVAYAQTLPEK